MTAWLRSMVCRDEEGAVWVRTWAGGWAHWTMAHRALLGWARLGWAWLRWRAGL